MAAQAINRNLLDDVVSAYVEWHKHSESVKDAYTAWTGATSSEASMRYAAYIEELDREQRACELYAATIDRAAAKAA